MTMLPEINRLGSFIIPAGHWETAPAEAREAAEKARDAGDPIAIGWHCDMGWFVICCDHDPYIVWRETRLQ